MGYKTRGLVGTTLHCTIAQNTTIWSVTAVQNYSPHTARCCDLYLIAEFCTHQIYCLYRHDSGPKASIMKSVFITWVWHSDKNSGGSLDDKDELSAFISVVCSWKTVWQLLTSISWKEDPGREQSWAIRNAISVIGKDSCPDGECVHSISSSPNQQ